MINRNKILVNKTEYVFTIPITLVRMFYLITLKLLVIKNGLASIELVFDKPFVTTATMLQYIIINLYKSVPNSLFIFVKRQP